MSIAREPVEHLRTELEATPYEETRALLDDLNEGVRRGARFTTDGERGILAMARKNDPFYAGQPSQRGPAEWFAGLFHRLGFGERRVHVRHVHYVACGEEPNPETGEEHQELLPDGTPYGNTQGNWEFIQEASKHARNMGLVDPRSIVDRRMKRPLLYAPEDPPAPPGVVVSEPTLGLPSIDPGDLEPFGSRGRAYPVGYDYDVSFEPSLVELWMEKSLDEEDDPIIDRLCREEGANLVPGVGFMTISSVYTMLERRTRLGKPLRILYLSDFDPAGSHMPVSPARHIEFALRKLPPEERSDIRLHHLALREDQVRGLGLPRIPIKDSDLRKGRFEERHGEGATELNALMIPTRRGRTQAMLRGAIRALRDDTLRGRLRAAEQEAQNRLDAELARRLHWPHLALEMIEEEAREIGGRYTEELQGIAERLAEEIAPLEERAERVLHAARRRLDGLEDAELPEVEGEEGNGSAEGWLYDSRRDYLDQLRHYKDR